MINTKELRQPLGAVSPEEVEEFLDRLEAAEEEKERLLGLAHDQNRELIRLREECRALRARVPEVDALAQFIRKIDGAHRLGAGILAEHIVAWLAAAPEAKS